MALQIIAEDFSLTDAIKASVQTQIEAIEKIVSGTSISIYLTEPTKGLFKAKFQVHALKKDFFAEDASEDLYRSLNAARHHICRQILDAKNTIVHNRHSS